MQIKIGHTKDERNKVDKNYTFTKTYTNAKLKENTSMIHPVFILMTTSDIKDINYVYVTEFKRFYFVNNIVCATGSCMELECVCDVLMSFKNDIRKCKAIINKQQSTSLSSQYIDDNSYVTECRTVVDATEFPSGFSNVSTIIITAGG